MTISNIRFKASGPGTDPASGPTTKEAVELKKKLEAALKQLEEAESFDEYFSIGEKMEMEKLQALLAGDLAALEHYLKTGEWTPPAVAAQTDNQNYFDLSSVDSGFYLQDPADRFAAPTKPAVNPNGGDEDLLEDGEDYMGTISVDNKGTIDPTTGEVIPANLWFIMTSSDDKSKDMQGISARTVGNDVVVTVTFKDEHQEAYVIKNGATRSDIRICVNALKSEHEVTVNLNRLVVIDPVTGKKNGSIVIGSQGDDTIYGSAGDDLLAGAGGADILDGMGGIDDVYGYADDGSNPESSVLASYGTDSLGEDGDDTIYDSYATSAETSDFIDGGDGWDTVTGSRGAPQHTEEKGTFEDAADSVAGWFDSGAATVNKNGEVVVTGDNVEFTAEDGWVVTAQEDADHPNDLVLVAVKPGEEGEPPMSQTIRIKGYFNDNQKLTIVGGFVDMGAVNVGARSVALVGTGSNGDILVGPKTVFDEYGITAEDLGTSNLDDATIEERLEYFREASKDDPSSPWANAEFDPATGRIVFDGTGELNIPLDFAGVAFVQKQGTTYIITVVGVDENGETGERMVLEIKNAGQDFMKNLTVNGSTSDEKIFDMTNSGSSGTGVTINGGEGVDFLAGFQYGTTVNDDSGDEGIKIEVEKLEGIKLDSSTPKTTTDIVAEIEACETLEDLGKLETKYAGLSEDDEDIDKEAVMNAINDQRAMLIDKQITAGEELGSLQAEIDKLPEGYDGTVTSKEDLQSELEAALEEGEE